MGIRVLLVEGDDDQHVIWNLRDVRGLPCDFYVVRPGGRMDMDRPGRVRGRDPVGDEMNGGDRRLLESIPARLDTSGLERLAIILDADDKGPQRRWESIRDRLASEGYDADLLPRVVATTGVVLDLPQCRGRKPIRFGIWIMPDNQANGMLEDFVASMIHDDDEMLPRVNDFLTSIPQEHRRFSPAHQSKARLHTWLAVSERPGRPMGQAIKAESHLDANHASVEPFLAWIRKALVD